MAPGDIPALSLAELIALAQTLKSIAQRNRDTDLADIAVKLIIYGASLAQLSTEDRESFTLRPTDYASMHNVPLRTVQRHCRSGKIPAIRQGRSWRIKA